jgi:hypothetical protein
MEMQWDIGPLVAVYVLIALLVLVSIGVSIWVLRECLERLETNRRRPRDWNLESLPPHQQRTGPEPNSETVAV